MSSPMCCKNCPSCVVCRVKKDYDIAPTLCETIISVLRKVIPFTSLSEKEQRYSIALFIDELSKQTPDPYNDQVNDKVLENVLERIADHYVAPFYRNRLDKRDQVFYNLQRMSYDSDSDDEYHDGALMDTVLFVYNALKKSKKSETKTKS